MLDINSTWDRNIFNILRIEEIFCADELHERREFDWARHLSHVGMVKHAAVICKEQTSGHYRMAFESQSDLKVDIQTLHNALFYNRARYYTSAGVTKRWQRKYYVLKVLSSDADSVM